MFDFRETLYSEFFIFPTWVSGEKTSQNAPGMRLISEIYSEILLNLCKQSVFTVITLHKNPGNFPNFDYETHHVC